MIKTKHCKHCNNKFDNLVKNGINAGRCVDSNRWKTRLFCSKACANKNQAKELMLKGKNPINYLKPWIKENGSWNKGKKLSIEYRKKLSDAHKGIQDNENNPAWKGDNVGYHALHLWINRHFGKPTGCKSCKDSNKKRYEWASIDHNYSRNKADWIMLCTSCHRNYDLGNITIPDAGQRVT